MYLLSLGLMSSHNFKALSEDETYGVTRSDRLTCLPHYDKEVFKCLINYLLCSPNFDLIYKKNCPAHINFLVVI